MLDYHETEESSYLSWKTLFEEHLIRAMSIQFVFPHLCEFDVDRYLSYEEKTGMV